jgi:hypothetical protein
MLPTGILPVLVTSSPVKTSLHSPLGSSRCVPFHAFPSGGTPSSAVKTWRYHSHGSVLMMAKEAMARWACTPSIFRG